MLIMVADFFNSVFAIYILPFCPQDILIPILYASLHEKLGYDL